MSFNIVTDPDDLLGEIPPNIMEDVERAVKRIEGLLPSIYRGIRIILDMARRIPLHTIYRQGELGIVRDISKLLENPGKSYLIGVPFQPALIEDDLVLMMGSMAVPTFQIRVLGPTKCVVIVFPVTNMFPDIILRSAFVHELVHCIARDPFERITYSVEKMLTDLAPDIFEYRLIIPPHMSQPAAEYIKRNRIPVMSYETLMAVGEKIMKDPEYARQILSKSVMIQLKPLVRGD